VLFGLAIAHFLIPVIRAEQAGVVGVPRTLVFLGDASYAIYLVHNPFMALLARALPAQGLLALAYLIATGTALGIAYHLIYERPAIAFVRRQFSRWHSGEPGPAT
jgi:peptidoglycan/LPS O-acetylase OafA/YrhL